MMSVKLLSFCAIMAIICMSVSADLLEESIPIIMQKYYKRAAAAEMGHHLVVESPDGIREEVQMILNPGTPEEETVVMGMYLTYDAKSGTETVTMYTADRSGYKARFTIKRKPRSEKLNKTLLKGN